MFFRSAILFFVLSTHALGAMAEKPKAAGAKSSKRLTRSLPDFGHCNEAICLHCSASEGDIPKVESALYTMSVDKLDYLKRTALYYAAMNRHIELVRWLRSMGADSQLVFKADKAKILERPLYEPIRYALTESLEVAPLPFRLRHWPFYQQKSFSERKHNIDLEKLADYFSRLPHQRGRILGEFLACCCLLKKDLSDLAYKDESLSEAFDSALLLSSRPWMRSFMDDKHKLERHIDHLCVLISWLLSNKWKLLFQEDVLGGHALHRAVNQCPPKIVALLLQEGAYHSVNIPDKLLRTPLAKAVIYEKHDLMLLLLAAGADFAPCQSFIDKLTKPQCERMIAAFNTR